MDSGGRELKPSASDEGARPLNYSAPETRSDSDPLARVSILCAVLFVPAFLFAATFDAPMPVFAAIFSLPFLAVAFGWLARRAEKTRALPATTLAKSALWLGCCALSLLLIGAVGFLMTELRKGRETVAGVRCLNNLRQVGQALNKYAQSHGGQFPPDLLTLVRADDLAPAVLVCPASGDTELQGLSTQAVIQKLASESNHCSYVYVGAGLTTGTVADTHILAYEKIPNHHGQTTGVLYGDGHAEVFGRADAGYIISELKAGRNPPQLPGASGAGPATSPSR